MLRINEGSVQSRLLDVILTGSLEIGILLLYGAALLSVIL